MFENLGAPEVLVLLLVALFIIGPERLPKMLGEVGKGIRKLRTMASNATADISREVGTDIDITDLNPKAFIRKHVLSEEDEAAIRNPLKSALSDLKKDTEGFRKDLEETTSSVRSTKFNSRRTTSPAVEDSTASAKKPDSDGDTSSSETSRFDLEAT